MDPSRKRLTIPLLFVLIAVLAGVGAEALADPRGPWRVRICGPAQDHICVDTPRGQPWVCGTDAKPVICYDRPDDD